MIKSVNQNQSQKKGEQGKLFSEILNRVTNDSEDSNVLIQMKPADLVNYINHLDPDLQNTIVLNCFQNAAANHKNGFFPINFMYPFYTDAGTIEYADAIGKAVRDPLSKSNVLCVHSYYGRRGRSNLYYINTKYARDIYSSISLERKKRLLSYMSPTFKKTLSLFINQTSEQSASADAAAAETVRSVISAAGGTLSYPLDGGPVIRSMLPERYGGFCISELRLVTDGPYKDGLRAYGRYFDDRVDPLSGKPVRAYGPNDRLILDSEVSFRELIVDGRFRPEGRRIRRKETKRKGRGM